MIMKYNRAMSPHKEGAGGGSGPRPHAPPLEESLPARLARVRERIRRAEQASGRRPGSVALLAAGKAQPVDAVRALAGMGQRIFGENYVQEALERMDALADLDVEWHFIGALQSNKTRAVAARFAWVHTVDRLRIARRLNDQRPRALGPLNVCIEVNVDRESAKSGVAPEQVAELAREVAALPRLRLRGLMAIPAAREGERAQREPFRRLRELRDQVSESGIVLDTLSMGMSADLEAAIAEGATIVRIGTALFGPRPGAP